MDDSLQPRIWIRRFLSRLIELRPDLSLRVADAIARIELEEFGDFNPEIAAEHFACRTTKPSPEANGRRLAIASAGSCHIA